DRTVSVLHRSPHEQCGAGPRDTAVSLPQSLRTDHVHHSGLVLDVEERDSPGGGGTLSMGHRATDEYSATVVNLRYLSWGNRAERVDPIPDELGGETRRRHSGGPYIGSSEVELVHPRQHRRLRAGPHR